MCVVQRSWPRWLSIAGHVTRARREDLQMNNSAYETLNQCLAEIGVSRSRVPGFDRFLREHREALLRFLRQRTATEEDAQDIAQESLVRLMRYRHDQPAEQWHALLYRIAGNLVIDQVRLAKTHFSEAHQPLDDNVYALPSVGASPEDWMSRQQALARTRDAIFALPERCQHIYLLNRIEGMSYPQIARHCGISVKAVEKQITKALALLRRQLGGGFDETL